jgi:hypothetical protein
MGNRRRFAIRRCGTLAGATGNGFHSTNGQDYSQQDGKTPYEKTKEILKGN